MRTGLDQIGAQLGYATRELSRQGGSCDLVLEPTDADNYLIGLTYRSGTEWVAASGNHCAGSTNGPFNSPANFGTEAATAFASGNWPAAPTGGSCGGLGRLGQEKLLVPGHPISLTVCARPYVTSKHRYVDQTPVVVHTSFAELVRKLNALQPTSPSQRGCALPHGGNVSAEYSLRFGYSAGPAVDVDIEVGCDPSIDNSSLQTKDSSTIVPIIKQLIAAN